MKIFATALIALLLRFCSPSNEEISRLVARLKDNDSAVRQEAALSLRDIGRSAEAAVPALVAALNDGDAEVRWHAAEALGNIGRAAQEAVPALIAALKDSDVRVRECSDRAFGRSVRVPRTLSLTSSRPSMTVMPVYEAAQPKA